MTLNKIGVPTRILQWLTADEELLDSETPDNDLESLELVEADAPQGSA